MHIQFLTPYFLDYMKALSIDFQHETYYMKYNVEKQPSHRDLSLNIPKMSYKKNGE